MSPYKASFVSVLGDRFARSREDSGLKVDTGIILYEESDGSSKVVGLVRISAAVVTDLDKLQYRV